MLGFSDTSFGSLVAAVGAILTALIAATSVTINSRNRRSLKTENGHTIGEGVSFLENAVMGTGHRLDRIEVRQDEARDAALLAAEKAEVAADNARLAADKAEVAASIAKTAADNAETAAAHAEKAHKAAEVAHHLIAEHIAQGEGGT